MHGRSRFRHLAGALLAGTGLWIALAAAAQATATIELTRPSTADFPWVSFYASVIDPEGFRVHALPLTSFQVLEDGEPVGEFTIEEETVGGRQIYALNAVEPLRRRDALGVTRLDQVRQALIGAWEARPDSSVADDLTLIAPGERLAVHASTPEVLASALETWTPTFSAASVGYDPLLEALTLALDPVPHPGMETAVVFLTPLLDRANEQVLGDAVALAATSDAAIHAVLIGTPEQAGTAEALRLRQATEATGGTFRTFDPQAELADLEAVLQDPRTRYAVEYRSPATTSGPHAVGLSVTTGDFAAVSEAAAFSIRLEPPQATFIQPPSEVVRRTDDPNRLLADIPPTSVELRLLITFADGHPRDIARLRFFVDGAVVETRESPPFDSVTWDVSTILETSRHQLQVEVTDSQGLTDTSEIHPVTVEVIPGPRGLEALRPALAPLAAGIAVIGLGIAGIAAWIRLGEIPADLGQEESGPGGIRGLRRASLGAFDTSDPAEAYLVPLRPDGTSGAPVALQGADLTVGSDPALCSLLLDDPSVSGFHARLTRRAAGDFNLRDQHSVAGTWVNDDPVGEAGRDLEHGDRIHFGRAAFDFRLAAPGPEPRAVVRPSNGSPRP